MKRALIIVVLMVIASFSTAIAGTCRSDCFDCLLPNGLAGHKVKGVILSNTGVVLGTCGSDTCFEFAC
jgi:hypothetical protein